MQFHQWALSHADLDALGNSLQLREIYRTIEEELKEDLPISICIDWEDETKLEKLFQLIGPLHGTQQTLIDLVTVPYHPKRGFKRNGYKQFCKNIEWWKDKLNAVPSVAVNTVLVDDESWFVGEEANQFITSAHDAVYDKIKEVFPEATVLQYGMWSGSSIVTMNEKKDAIMPMLYRLWHTEETCHKIATAHEDSTIHNVPIALWLGIMGYMNPNNKKQFLKNGRYNFATLRMWGRVILQMPTLKHIAFYPGAMWSVEDAPQRFLEDLQEFMIGPTADHTNLQVINHSIEAKKHELCAYDLRSELHTTMNDDAIILTDPDAQKIGNHNAVVADDDLAENVEGFDNQVKTHPIVDKCKDPEVAALFTAIFGSARAHGQTQSEALDAMYAAMIVYSQLLRGIVDVDKLL